MMWYKQTLMVFRRSDFSKLIPGPKKPDSTVVPITPIINPVFNSTLEKYLG